MTTLASHDQVAPQVRVPTRQHNVERSLNTVEAQTVRAGAELPVLLRSAEATTQQPQQPSPPKRREVIFRPLERWEGVVLDIGGEIFTARLTKGTRQVGPDEEADFDLEEVSPEDQPLLKPGAIFYWTTGYETAAHGQRQIVSRLRFQRLPPPTEEELQTAKEAARKRIERRGWDPR